MDKFVFWNVKKWNNKRDVGKDHIPYGVFKKIYGLFFGFLNRLDYL